MSQPTFSEYLSIYASVLSLAGWRFSKKYLPVFSIQKNKKEKKQEKEEEKGEMKEEAEEGEKKDRKERDSL